jgi:hypothetical protein
MAMKNHRATRVDIPPLTHLRPYVHDIHVAAHPDNLKPVTPAAATRDVESLLGRAEPVGYAAY